MKSMYSMEKNYTIYLNKYNRKVNMNFLSTVFMFTIIVLIKV